MLKKFIKGFTTTIFIFAFVLATEQPAKAQYKDIEHLYSGCGYLLAEIMYGNYNIADTSANLYSGYGFTLAKALY